jgi:flagellin
MAVINTNVKALFSQSALRRTEGAMSNAMAQLSTGKRINTAADDAAGLAIATRMTHQIRSLNQAIRNAGDAINLIQTAEGATNEITDMMQRMRELAIQAVNDTNDNPQRSYLDLEFQQLKAEIVHIAESTEWNGFPVLNGTAGERVGEMPVLKTTSVSRFSDVFASSVITTPAEQQTLEFSNLSFGTGVSSGFSIGAYSITLDATVISATSFASGVVAALELDEAFKVSGRTVALSGTGEGVVITFAVSEEDVPEITFSAGISGIVGDPTITTDRQGASTQENFADGGGFIHQGQLSFELYTDGSVSGLFTNLKGEPIVMTGKASLEDGTITFLARDETDPNNRNNLVITQDLVYTLKDRYNDPVDLTARSFGISVAVGSATPALEAGDLMINGVDIGASYAEDDTLSPPNNAAGSAIAIAAAINRMAGDTGVSTGESQSILFTGIPVPGETISVGGVNIQLTSNEKTSAQAAAKIASELRNSSLFSQSTGRVISYAPGSSAVKIDFPVIEGNVQKTEINLGSTGLQSIVDTVQEFSKVRPGTGVFAKVNENVFTGHAMTRGASSQGTLIINGYSTANVTTVLNNTRATREQVVTAINAISRDTGVKAIDTGFDEKGITLVAADGRNIEVQFKTDENSNTFGSLVGLRQGVQTATYSLQSKIEAPIVLSSVTSGKIERTGLIEGNFTRNQSVFNTAPRASVAAPQAQVMSLNVFNLTNDDSFFVTINGKTLEVKASSVDSSDNPQGFRAKLQTAIDQQIEGVTASFGRSVGELLLTADMPGTPFTVSIKGADANTGILSPDTVIENQPAQFKRLSKEDLVINGVKIRSTNAKDDLLSSSVAASSDPASSAIAIANAINSHSAETGVRAVANPIVSKGLHTDTSMPASTWQSFYINGTEISVFCKQDEEEGDRIDNVVEAINSIPGLGVRAINNGSGVTLESDGRNLSVWFNSSIENLSPATFGLEKTGAVAQVSRVTINGTVNPSQETYVTINGVEIESGVSFTTQAEMAEALYSAINAKILDGTLVNISVDWDGDNQIEITSTLPGSPFELSAASVLDGTEDTEVSIDHVIPNSIGDNDITGIRDASATSTQAKTLYGTVRLISDPALLPKLPSPIGAPPSDQLEKLKATGRPFTISVGDSGFESTGNFSALGFQEGAFGGRSSEDMDPPRVGRLAFQVGPSANQFITIDLADFGKGGNITGELTGDIDLNVEDRRTRINTREGASSVLRILDDAMDKVNATRATMGAVMNRLDHVINNLSNVSMNLSESRSHIEDADYAKASTELAKTQIMQQAATAVLAQANTSQQTVLKLLG